MGKFSKEMEACSPVLSWNRLFMQLLGIRGVLPRIMKSAYKRCINKDYEVMLDTLAKLVIGYCNVRLREKAEGMLEKILLNRGLPKAKSYYLFDGYAHLSSGLACCLAGLYADMAIGMFGDAGVRVELSAEMWSSCDSQKCFEHVYEAQVVAERESARKRQEKQNVRL
ncbi:hypothetical protein POM88_025500 [Heracleum sosnowskyi]|uniref:Uncharacterized protein n=1 Tax=Heracleum sosnowskyi TaxID=360622 RepID=A0AAD8I4A2_9APIA|nr:hypothetical protein POM88_025500 [Heracleum sosnowskyi]